MTTRPAMHLAVSIERPCAEVAAFVADPANIARWAAGLASGLEPRGDVWVGRGPDGRDVSVRFTPSNPFGVADHAVTLHDGRVVDVPVRVLPNHDGAEVVITLFRQPAMDDAGFAADRRAVERDLAQLKALLESRGP